MLCREREPECLYNVPVSDRWNMHFVILLCLLRLSTLSLLDVLKFSRVILSGLQEKLTFRCQQISRDWIILDTISTNCGCPNKTLESL